jgi:acyl CoA:acetate/3-ketoacid CoA transferase beta subunit
VTANYSTDYTLDELMSVCISRQIVNGEVIGQGIATPLVMAGVLLAKLTHAPDIYFASAIGGAVVRNWAPLSLTHVEKPWLDHALALVTFGQIACELLPTFKVKEFFRPAQIDRNGNFNNVMIGDNYDRPQLRLPGSGGIADVTGYNDKTMLYVPRHSRAVFVEKVDFISGLGYAPTRSTDLGPKVCITNLGQFDFADGLLRLTSFHAGQSIEKVQAKTGFELQIAPDVCETEPPTAEEVRLLREEIDPLSVRKMETLSGAQRKQLIREILQREKSYASRVTDFE